MSWFQRQRKSIGTSLESVSIPGVERSASSIGSTEEISIKNLSESIKVGSACFDAHEDRLLLRLTYLLYTAHIRIFPNAVHNLPNLINLKAYNLYSDTDGQSIGVGGLYNYYHDETTFWLGWLGVIPERRGQGWGRKIVSDLESKARLFGGKKIMLYHDTDDIGLDVFYEKLGYSKVPSPFIFHSPVTVREKRFCNEVTDG